MVDGDSVSDGRPTLTLNRACREGHLDVVEYLVEQGGAAMDSQDNVGWTPLLHASRGGHFDVVRRYLVEQGGAAAVGVMINNGSTPLNSACREGHLDVIRNLVEQGVLQWMPRTMADGNLCMLLVEEGAIWMW
jgi:ankyrin repeat protein